jgi:hypothetical protein
VNALDLEQDLWQTEARTQLAWSRSGLSVLACVVLFGRRLTELVSSGRGQVFALAIIVAIAGVTGLFGLAWRARNETHAHTHLRWITAGTVGLAVVALVLALLPLPK